MLQVDDVELSQPLAQPSSLTTPGTTLMRVVRPQIPYLGYTTRAVVRREAEVLLTLANLLANGPQILSNGEFSILN